MKKIYICLFLIISLLFTASFPAFASEEPIYQTQEDGSTIISYANGSKLTISGVYIIEDNVSICATSKTTTSKRVVTYETKSGDLEWKYTLTGTFSYIEGVSVSCTNSTYSQEIYGSFWKFYDGSATKSGNVAYGSGRYELKILFFNTKTYNINISLTCDKYGNVT